MSFKFLCFTLLNCSAILFEFKDLSSLVLFLIFWYEQYSAPTLVICTGISCLCVALFLTLKPFDFKIVGVFLICFVFQTLLLCGNIFQFFVLQNISLCAMVYYSSKVITNTTSLQDCVCVMNVCVCVCM